MRPLRHLATLMHRYPALPRHVDEFRVGRGHALPNWPPWCFVPMAAWHAVALADATPQTLLECAADIAVLAALAPWRYTQGVYRFDDTLLDALAATEITGILPASVFLRLPQWSLYVELPASRFRWHGEPLHGFWAHLEWDAGEHAHGRHELRLLLDRETGLLAVPLHLGPFSVVESLRQVVAEARRSAAAYGLPAEPDILLPPDLPQQFAADLTPLLSLLLYLCADAPEIDDTREPGAAPHNPRPRRVKTGLRLFPPSKPTLWRVGEHTGAQLRAAGMPGSAEQGTTSRPVRPHIRRGHWHGYWTGPRAPERQAERGFVYHWLPPQIIGA